MPCVPRDGIKKPAESPRTRTKQPAMTFIFTCSSRLSGRRFLARQDEPLTVLFATLPANEVPAANVSEVPEAKPLTSYLGR